MNDLKEFVMEPLEGKIYIKHGYAFKGEHFTNQGQYILLTPGNVHADGGIKLDEPNEKYYKGDFPKEFIFKKGDLVIVMTDLTQEAAILGGAFLIPSDNRFLHNQRLGKIQILKPEELDKKFLYYIFNFQLFRGQVRASASGTTVKHTAPERIYKCIIPFPSVDTQKRIASILSAYDDLIEVNNQRIKLLEETARELYKEWFVRMRFPGYKEAKFVKGVPEGWEVKELKYFGKIHTGKTPSTKVREYYGGEIPFIKTPDLHKNQFVFETEEYLTDKGNNTQKRSSLPKGSICVSCIGTGGIVGITTAEISQTNQQINSLIPANRKYTEFLYYAICDLKETIELFGGTGATMTNLSKGKFEKLKMLFANKGLVEKYNSLVYPIFEQIQILQQQNTQLRQIRDRLLPRLISGKLEVKPNHILKVNE